MAAAVPADVIDENYLFLQKSIFQNSTTATAAIWRFQGRLI